MSAVTVPTITHQGRVLSISEWATERGQNQRWLDRKIAESIMSYHDHYRALVAAEPERRAFFKDQLGEALRAQLDYAVWLAERAVLA